MEKISAIDFFKMFCPETVKLYLAGVISFVGERQSHYFSVDKGELQEIVNISKITEYDSINDIQDFIETYKDGKLFEIIWDGNPDVIDKDRAIYLLGVIRELNKC